MEKMSQGLLLKHDILHNVWEIPSELQAKSNGSVICRNPTILITAVKRLICQVQNEANIYPGLMNAFFEITQLFFC